MTGFSLKIASISMTACLCLFAFSPSATAQKGGVRKPKKKPQAQEQPKPQLPAYTPAPLQPLPLEQVPAVAPKVNFSEGELTIVAHNSTLSDVLKEVREQTGAELDIPPNANERVVADLGPGPARSVLADLLNGTHFNYVMVGSITDPKAIQSIVLTPRTSGPDTATTAANRPGAPQPGFGRPATMTATPAEVGPSGDDGAEEPDAPDDQADQPEQQADQNQQNTNGQPNTPKTPEQLLQELQRQQQQMQQQQNQQPGQTGQPGQNGQTPPGVVPNQPPTGAAPTPAKPE